jgi:hypothetical protein
MKKNILPAFSLILFILYSCNPSVNNSSVAVSVINKDSLICSERVEEAQHKIDSIFNLSPGDGDTSSFENSPYGKKDAEMKKIAFDSTLTCPAALGLVSDFLTKENNLKGEFKNYAFDEKHKNDPPCNEPEITSFDIEKNQDFQPFLVATIKNNCNRGILSLKLKVDYRNETNQKDESTSDNFCIEYRVVKVEIKPYSEEKISMPLQNHSNCFNSDNPKVEILEYYDTDGHSNYMAKTIMDNVSKKVKSEMRQ